MTHTHHGDQVDLGGRVWRLLRPAQAAAAAVGQWAELGHSRSAAAAVARVQERPPLSRPTSKPTSMPTSRPGARWAEVEAAATPIDERTGMATVDGSDLLTAVI